MLNSDNENEIDCSYEKKQADNKLVVKNKTYVFT